ncbi:MAG: hypothetical protein KIS78_15180, partial [Labilithrix sp.]|nr:hypothetical protein [Labilithrix sp.]
MKKPSEDLAFADTVTDFAARSGARGRPGDDAEDAEAGARAKDTRPTLREQLLEAEPVGREASRARRILRGVEKWGLRLAIAALVLSALAVLAGWLLVRHYEEGLPSVAELERGYRPSQVTRVLARDGTTIAELFTERRTIVRVE